jgi:hypothetical protein
VAERNPLFLSDTGGVDTVEDTRLGLGALMMPGASSIATQTGLRPGPVDPGAVTASGTADKFVHIAPLQGFIQSARATAPGMYVVGNDAAKAIDLLTANPANATNPRNDLIIAQVTDKFYSDVTQGFTIKQIVGTPSGSPVDPTVPGSVDYFLLARVRVPANATTIVTGNITDLRPGWVVALGGLLPVPSVTVRNALAGKYDGMQIYRQDRNWVEIYDGAAWRVQGVGIVTSIADLAAITDPVAGQLASNTADGLIYKYTGSAWVGMPAGIMAAPTTTTSDGTATSAGTETRDAVLGNYAFTAVAGHRYRVWLTGRAIQGAVANDRYAVRIRNGGGSTPTTASTQVAECDVITYIIGGNGLASFICVGTFIPGAGTVTLGVFTLKAIGTGPGTPKTIGTVTEFYAEDLGAV